MPEQGAFAGLALGIYAVAHAVYCDESCAHIHDGHGCEHEGHACGCPHSERYDFEFDLPDIDDTDDFMRRLSAFVGTLPSDYSAAQIEDALERWWCGENRALRRAMEGLHARHRKRGEKAEARRIRRCERGRGRWLNVRSGEMTRAPCKSWRECEYCARVYGKAVEKRIGQVRALRAFVVLTMPAELGDWSNKAHIAAQARAMRRLAERLFRRFKRRFVTLWTREHNTKKDGNGRLHLNMLWDQDWVDQSWLSETAKACGFGKVVWISRVRDDGLIVAGEGRGQNLARYVTKCLRYASKDLKSQTDWPKNTRRWGASKAARAQMQRPARNPDWLYLPEEPPSGFLPFDVLRFKVARVPGCVCCLCRGKGGHGIAGSGCVSCICGAGGLRVPLRYEERRDAIGRAARASPG